MKIYTIVNDNDPNDSFEVRAQNSNDAAFAALGELGWWIAQGDEMDGDEIDGDEDADADNSHE